MTKRYSWHIIFALFVVLCLSNIFQKIKWNGVSDNITWEPSSNGLICLAAPANSLIKPGDTLLSVNNYAIGSKIDLLRIIENRNYCRYEVEREGILKNIGVDITPKFTSFSYYIMAFIGILFLLLTLGLLNNSIKPQAYFSPPPVFLILALAFSGILIFSPTPNYGSLDFLYLILDNIAFILFPAVLLHYSLEYPITFKPYKKIPPSLRLLLIYLPPLAIIIFNLYFVMINLANPVVDILLTTLNHFRTLTSRFFVLYLALAWGIQAITTYALVIGKKQNRYIFPFIGLSISLVSLLILNLLSSATLQQSPFVVYLGLSLLIFLPLSLVYFLSQRRFTDIENIIKKTISISSLFVFIFGIYLFLSLNIEQNKLLGIFWSIAAILTAGLLFKPVEGTIQKYFEKIFYRETFNFKRKLKELEHSISAQRDLYSLSISFLEIINKGFQLKSSALIIHSRHNIFYSLPQRSSLILSKTFRAELLRHDHLIFLSDQEFKAKFPRDYHLFATHKLCQFMPLKNNEKLIGIVAFGKKLDRTFLSVEDWELLFSISSSLSLSVENAFLYSELEKKLNELNLLKEFNENIVENINLGIVVISHLNRIKTWNNFMEKKFLIRREAALNRLAQTVLDPEITEKTKGTRAMTDTIRNIKLTINDNECIFDIYMSPLQNAFGGHTDRIMVFEDVTEKNRIQNQLLTSEKMASLGLLSTGVAHEINTPLTGISSYCQLLLGSTPEAGVSKELITKIQDQVLRANKIVRTLLDFSRPKSEHPAEIDLSKIIDESISLIEHRLKKKEITIRKSLQIQQRFFGYPTRLQQLFINLFINSIDAITDRGDISLQGQEDDKWISLRFKDNGRGIKEKYLDKIFDPFFTTKEIGQGTGMGLSIVYNIVKEHYGHIEVHSKFNKGTTFYIEFPLNSPLRSMRI